MVDDVEGQEALPRALPAAEDELWTIKRASQYLKVSVSWLYRQVLLKEVPHCRFGRSIRFTRAALDAWVRQKLASTPPNAPQP